MSLIGPRPERPAFCAEFEKRIHGWHYRTVVTPGLSGLAQVTGGYDLLPKEKVVLDLRKEFRGPQAPRAGAVHGRFRSRARVRRTRLRGPASGQCGKPLGGSLLCCQRRRRHGRHQRVGTTTINFAPSGIAHSRGISYNGECVAKTVVMVRFIENNLRRMFSKSPSARLAVHRHQTTDASMARPSTDVAIVPQKSIAYRGCRVRGTAGASLAHMLTSRPLKGMPHRRRAGLSGRLAAWTI